jgi:hypothetical protein
MAMPRRSSGSAAVYWGRELAGRQYEILATNARIARITRRGSERGGLFLEGRERREETAGPRVHKVVIWVFFSFINQR